jgi:hypothetical protein
MRPPACRPCGNRLEGAHFRARQAGANGGQLLEQAAHGVDQQARFLHAVAHEVREGHGLRRPDRVPGRTCCHDVRPARRAARRPERLELARIELAQTAERRHARKRGHDDQLGQDTTVVREREGVDQLQLVEQVVLDGTGPS